MTRPFNRGLVASALVALSAVTLHAQKSSGPAAGTLIVDGGAATEPVVRRFVEIAGGRQAKIVVFATGPSSLRFGPQNTILNPDWPRDRPKSWASASTTTRRWW